MKKILACLLVAIFLLLGSAVGASAAPATAQLPAVEAIAAAETDVDDPDDLDEPFWDPDTFWGGAIQRFMDFQTFMWSNWFTLPIAVVFFPISIVVSFFLGVLYGIFHG